MTKLNEALKEHGYESAMHFVCEILCEQFESSDADNYIEMTFSDKEDESKSYILTMQKASGVTPCQKVDTLTEQNKQLVEALEFLDTFVRGCEINHDIGYVGYSAQERISKILAKHKEQI